MIGIVDYGAGNLASVRNAFARLDRQAAIIRQPGEIEGCDRIVLPGVGSFQRAMATLHAGGWADPLRTFARSGRPLLGVCLGMQLLFDCGDEHGPTAGLGLMAGRVTLMTPSAPLKVPHVGWNSLEHVREHPLFSGVKHHVDFYFVHSYHCLPSDPADVVARCDYGGAFVAAVARANVAGTQFHPEKSQPSGLGILENFAAWDPTC